MGEFLFIIRRTKKLKAMNKLRKFIIQVTGGKSFDEAAKKAGYGSLEEPRKALLELADRINKCITGQDLDLRETKKVLSDISCKKPAFLEIYCDGASKGNPGPASAAAVAYLPSGMRVASRVKKLGSATNNVAEYQALILGLSLAKDIGVNKVYFKLDSQLVVRQLSGEYRIKNDKLKILVKKVKEMELHFEKCEYQHICRSRNKEADKLAGDILAGKED